MAEELVAGASLAGIRRRGVPRRPENLIRGGIVGSRVPRRTAASLPRIALPRFMPRLARSRDGIEPPFASAGCRVVGVDEAAHSVLAASNPNYHQVLPPHRRHLTAPPLLLSVS